MIIENPKSFLELKVIWKDDEMIELRVTASNSNFYGKTKVYADAELLHDFAEKLTNYPKNGETLFYTAGIKKGYSYFSMKYYPVSNTGKIGVEINLECNTSSENFQEEKDNVKLEIIVEPSAIDNFQKELFTLAKNEDGTAILYGRDNRI